MLRRKRTLLAVGLLVALGLVWLLLPAPETPEMRLIDVGMSYDEVRAIAGSPHGTLGPAKWVPPKEFMPKHVWDRPEGQMAIQFNQEGRVVKKELIPYKIVGRTDLFEWLRRWLGF